MMLMMPGAGVGGGGGAGDVQRQAACSVCELSPRSPIGAQVLLPLVMVFVVFPLDHARRLQVDCRRMLAMQHPVCN